MALTDAQLLAALRLSDSPEETQQVVRLRPVARTMVQRFAPAAPELIKDEAVVRIAGYYFDLPYASRGTSLANAMANSGAGALLLPYREHRAGGIRTAPAGDGGDSDFGGDFDPMDFDAIDARDQTARDAAAAAQSTADDAAIAAAAAQSTADDAVLAAAAAQVAADAALAATDAAAVAAAVADAAAALAAAEAAQTAADAAQQTGDAAATAAATAQGRADTALNTANAAFTVAQGKIGPDDVADWAEEGNTDPIPAGKLANAPSGSPTFVELLSATSPGDFTDDANVDLAVAAAIPTPL